MDVKAAATERLIRTDEVLHICGFSRSSLYASIQKGDFPAQVKLSKKASAWLYSEVTAWFLLVPRSARYQENQK